MLTSSFSSKSRKLKVFIYLLHQYLYRFTGIVKLKSILLDCFADSSAPSEMRAFINIPDLDFSSAEAKTPTQIWTLVAPDSVTKDPIEYPTKYKVALVKI